MEPSSSTATVAGPAAKCGERLLALPEVLLLSKTFQGEGTTGAWNLKKFLKDI